MLLRPFCHADCESSLITKQTRRDLLGLAAVSSITIAALLSGCTSSQLHSSPNSEAATNSGNKPDGDIKQSADNFSTDLTKVNSNTGKADSIHEKMNGLSYQENTVNASVISTGCTSDSHFKVNHSIEGDTCQLLVVREKPDQCKAAPYLQNISVQWSKTPDCDNRKLMFLNPSLPATEHNAIKGISR